MAATIRRLANPQAIQPLSAYPPPLNVSIRAAAVLSRSPLVLPPLSPLERHYYHYQRLIRRALGAPVLPHFWFKLGSLAERQWAERESMSQTRIAEGKGFEITDADLRELEVPQTKADKEGNTKSLKRKLERSLYLLLKYRDGWKFPTTTMNGEATLVEAALKGLEEQCGKNVDAWNVGRAPGAVFMSKEEYTFFLPVRLLQGQAEITSKEVEDFAWCTAEEVEEKVTEEYWQSVGAMIRGV